MRGRFSVAWTPCLFGFLLSAVMSCMVSGIAVLRVPGALQAWMISWVSSSAVALPVVLIAAPFVRRIVAYLVASPAKPAA
jgi:hypothetical protein